MAVVLKDAFCSHAVLCCGMLCCAVLWHVMKACMAGVWMAVLLLRPCLHAFMPHSTCRMHLPHPLQLVPALSKWGGAVVGLTLLAIGATGLYETFFEQHEEGEHGEHDPAAEALTGACRGWPGRLPILGPPPAAGCSLEDGK